MGCFDSRRRRREVEGIETSCSSLMKSNKKQKVMMGLDRKQKELCWKILVGLIEHPFASVVVQIPDSKEVRRPMDLTTVQSKLEKGHYSTVDAFVDDVKLTFSNASWFYPSGDKDRAKARHLSSVFETKWKLVATQTESHIISSPVTPLRLEHSKINNNNLVIKKEAKSCSKDNNNLVASTSSSSCCVVQDQVEQGRIQLLREKARQDILKTEKDACSNYQNTLQDLQQLQLLCRGGGKVRRVFTLENLGLYLKRDEFDGFEYEDEYLNGDGDWEEGEIRY